MGGDANELLYEVPYHRKVGIVRPVPEVPGWADIILALKREAAKGGSCKVVLNATTFTGTASLPRR